MQALLAAAKWAAVQARLTLPRTLPRTLTLSLTLTLALARQRNPNPEPDPNPNSNSSPNQARQASDAAETRALGAERVATEVPPAP